MLLAGNWPDLQRSLAAELLFTLISGRAPADLAKQANTLTGPPVLSAPELAYQ